MPMIGATMGSHNGHHNGLTTTEGQSYCFTHCQWDADWNQCMRNCLYRKDQDGIVICKAFGIGLFITGLILGSFLMACYLVYRRRRKERKHTKHEQSAETDGKTTESVSTDSDDGSTKCFPFNSKRRRFSERPIDANKWSLPSTPRGSDIWSGAGTGMKDVKSKRNNSALNSFGETFEMKLANGQHANRIEPSQSEPDLPRYRNKHLDNVLQMTSQLSGTARNRRESHSNSSLNATPNRTRNVFPSYSFDEPVIDEGNYDGVYDDNVPNTKPRNTRDRTSYYADPFLGDDVAYDHENTPPLQPIHTRSNPLPSKRRHGGMLPNSHREHNRGLILSPSLPSIAGSSDLTSRNRHHSSHDNASVHPFMFTVPLVGDSNVENFKHSDPDSSRHQPIMFPSTTLNPAGITTVETNQGNMQPSNNTDNGNLRDSKPSLHQANDSFAKISGNVPRKGTGHTGMDPHTLPSSQQLTKGDDNTTRGHAKPHSIPPTQTGGMENSNIGIVQPNRHDSNDTSSQTMIPFASQATPPGVTTANRNNPGINKDVHDGNGLYNPPSTTSSSGRNVMPPNAEFIKEDNNAHAKGSDHSTTTPYAIPPIIIGANTSIPKAEIQKRIQNAETIHDVRRNESTNGQNTNLFVNTPMLSTGSNSVPSSAVPNCFHRSKELYSSPTTTPSSARNLLQSNFGNTGLHSDRSTGSVHNTKLPHAVAPLLIGESAAIPQQGGRWQDTESRDLKRQYKSNKEHDRAMSENTPMSFSGPAVVPPSAMSSGNRLNNGYNSSSPSTSIADGNVHFESTPFNSGESSNIRTTTGTRHTVPPLVIGGFVHTLKSENFRQKGNNFSNKQHSHHLTPPISDRNVFTSEQDSASRINRNNDTSNDPHDLYGIPRGRSGRNTFDAGVAPIKPYVSNNLGQQQNTSFVNNGKNNNGFRTDGWLPDGTTDALMGPSSPRLPSLRKSVLKSQHEIMRAKQSDTEDLQHLVRVRHEERQESNPFDFRDEYPFNKGGGYSYKEKIMSPLSSTVRTGINAPVSRTGSLRGHFNDKSSKQEIHRSSSVPSIATINGFGVDTTLPSVEDDHGVEVIMIPPSRRATGNTSLPVGVEDMPLYRSPAVPVMRARSVLTPGSDSMPSRGVDQDANGTDRSPTIREQTRTSTESLMPNDDNETNNKACKTLVTQNGMTNSAFVSRIENLVPKTDVVVKTEPVGFHSIPSVNSEYSVPTSGIEDGSKRGDDDTRHGKRNNVRPLLGSQTGSTNSAFVSRIEGLTSKSTHRAKRNIRDPNHMQSMYVGADKIITRAESTLPINYADVGNRQSDSNDTNDTQTTMPSIWDLDEPNDALLKPKNMATGLDDIKPAKSDSNLPNGLSDWDEVIGE